MYIQIKENVYNKSSTINSPIWRIDGGEKGIHSNSSRAGNGQINNSPKTGAAK